MTPRTLAAWTGAGVTVLAVVAGILSGQIHPTTTSSDGGVYADHVVIDLDGGPQPGDQCVWGTALASTQAAQLFGYVPPPDAGATLYVRTRVCATPVDGGSGVVGLPPGLTLVYNEDAVDWVPDAGLHSLEVWGAGRLDAPFLCACAPRGGTCEVFGAAVGIDAGPGLVFYGQPGTTFQPGAFVAGTGCRAKPCIELSGISSMPPECL